MLLQGVIDSPDIPLNVSGSYLQSDAAVKKISSYITKKVSARLEEIFKSDRVEYESKWDDIKIFIEYGMLTEQKFCESAMKFVMLSNIDGKHFTLDEYKTLIESEQTDKDGNLIYLYATDAIAQYNYINSAKEKGYDVLLMDGQLDSHFIGLLESKLEKSQFVRVDSDVISNLIKKDTKKEVSLTQLQREILTTEFRSQIPAIEKCEFVVSFEAMGEADAPLVITQGEYMRRMKEMAAMQPGMSFYGELPDSYSLIVNTDHPLVAKVTNDADANIATEVSPIFESISSKNNQISELRKDNKETDEVKQLELEVSELRSKQEHMISEYASKQAVVKQLIDLALLGNGLLKGEALSSFIKRSVELL
jgi:molecular chaperone HtpG